MRQSSQDDERKYEALRGDPVATIDNLLRWERIKLREAAQQALEILESNATPTREYLDYMWSTDVGMREVRTRMSKLRDRIAELEAIKADATTDF